MNISLRQVKTDASQTVFITSTGTVLFTLHATHDPLGYLSTTSITSMDHQGSTTQVGFIKWNENTGDSPYLCMGASLMELHMMKDAGCFSSAFLGNNGRRYCWKTVNNLASLFADGVSLAPIAITYDDSQSLETSSILCIQPTGFPLLREIVATFILFQKLFEQTSVHDSKPDGKLRFQVISPYCPGNYVSRERRTHPSSTGRHTQHVSPLRVLNRQDNAAGHAHVPCLRKRNSHATRFTVDLTGQLLKRHKYPSAYGGFGDIWKCDWIRDSRVIEVAVKVMRTNATDGKRETEIKIIYRELKVWVKLEHECVLPLYGISFDFGRFPAMVCPCLEGGTLSKYLERHEELPLNARLQLLGDIADGLHYLHGCSIVHGDLTGVHFRPCNPIPLIHSLSKSNVLIKDNGKACLSDFGLSRILMDATGNSYYLTSTIRGSVRWAAPELFEIDEEQHHSKESMHAVPSPQTDVYSFGSVMLQVLTGKVPYHYYKNDAQVLIALSRGLRPMRPDNPPIDEDHWKFMQRCWVATNRTLDTGIVAKRSSSSTLGLNHRPSIEEVVDFLTVARDML